MDELPVHESVVLIGQVAVVLFVVWYITGGPARLDWNDETQVKKTYAKTNIQKAGVRDYQTIIIK
jgi:hypothetical protein